MFNSKAFERLLNNAPEWATWVARDWIGFWYYYETKPKLNSDMWFCDKRSKQSIDDEVYCDWHHSETLIKIKNS